MNYESDSSDGDDGEDNFSHKSHLAEAFTQKGICFLEEEKYKCLFNKK